MTAMFEFIYCEGYDFSSMRGNGDFLEIDKSLGLGLGLRLGEMQKSHVG